MREKTFYFKNNEVVYVYVLHNDINGKEYVGISYRPIFRWGTHCKSETIIGNALRKYGLENFTKEIIFVGSRTDALYKEYEYCVEYKTLSPDGYNAAAGGRGVAVISPRSEESRLKSSLSQLGKKASPEARKKMSESKRGRVSPNKGKTASTESRLKMSISSKGSIPWNKGKSLSEDHRKNLSESKKSKGFKYTEEQKAEMSAARKGKKKSPEARQRMKEAQQRRSQNMTPEQKEKMRLVALERERKKREGRRQ